MPAPYVGSTEILGMNVGTTTINKAYVGSTLVFQYDPVQVLTLTSATDLNLATWLSGQGADSAKPVIINMASDQIIGGTVSSGYALDTGDISSYTAITFNLDGQIQAKAGAHALHANNDIAISNSGTITGSINSVGGSGTPNLTINIGATGKILAGGGNGGSGGRGGYGHTLGTPNYQVKTSNLQYGQGNGSNDPAYGVYWYSAYKGIGGSSGIQWASFWFAPWGSYYSGGLRDCSRADILYASGGNGGAGGVGQGYLQTKTTGSAGNSGSGRSGAGGAGGDGGDWGVAGTNGSTGSSGLAYNGTNPNYSTTPYSGYSGSAAGNAVDCDAYVDLT